MSEPLQSVHNKQVQLDLGKITSDDLNQLRENCLERIRAGELYDLQNEAKLRAVNTTQSYEEFKGIVDAAHLRSITKQDKANAKTRTRIWNTTARED